MRVLNFPPKKNAISQQRLSKFLKAKRLLDQEAAELLYELENGAAVESGDHQARIREIRQGAVSKRVLVVE